ncbi:ATP-binding protein [Haloarcula sp. S1CR25-12]|uniref:ATP-binding protein n=1 Tax=Haloarcula saliterrae TaxID=2950534 RepID=A0ABU2FI15_9EURY|nr:ATP-binding protein [Haloarcula sp. S1CR25-12]MDS0261892.1 ATP-binding protein [Haloarcula sp. S1CR25-12]
MNSEEVKKRIAEILEQHQGSSNTITSREIREQLNHETDEAPSKVRKLISELVLEEELPVASNSNGYYLIQDEDELEDYVDKLEKRARGINERKLGVQRAVGTMVFRGESRDFELKDKRSDRATIVKELVALGNTEGGTLVIGASEQGEDIEIQTVDDPDQWEESVNQCLVELADPPFDIEYSEEEIGEGRVVIFRVEQFSTLRTYNPGNEKHCVPSRAGTTTTYLTGGEIQRFYDDSS